MLVITQSYTSKIMLWEDMVTMKPLVPCANSSLSPTIDIEQVSVNVEAQTINVKGKIFNSANEQQITTLIYPKESDYNDIASILYIDQCKITPDSENKFDVVFPLNMNTTDNLLTIRIGGTNIQTPAVYNFDLAASTLITSDINNDCHVEVYDLSVLLDNYGLKDISASDSDVDINGDGQVDSSDLSKLLDNYGKQLK